MSLEDKTILDQVLDRLSETIGSLIASTLEIWLDINMQGRNFSRAKLKTLKEHAEALIEIIKVFEGLE